MVIYSDKDFIKAIKKYPENFFIIHYSCQNLNDDNQTLSPRITSIAILCYQTEQTISFSTHTIAEELGISKEDIASHLDKIEFTLLEQFFEFIQDRKDKYWIHWNMINITYGFEHLEHRFKVLGGKAKIIPVEHRINLHSIIAKRYGSNYAKNPKMISLMELNGGRHRNFLTGKEEVIAFENNEFSKMHKSTLVKINFFHFVIRQIILGKLKTDSKRIGVNIDNLLESRMSKIIALIASIIGIGGILFQIVKFISNNVLD